MEKVYVLNAYGEEHQIVLRKSTYMDNNTLAVIMYEIMPDGHEEQWSVLTVNIEFSCASDDSAHIDTNNNGESIIKWLEDNNIATDTGIYGFSGYCSYPLVIFNAAVLKEMVTL